METSGSATFLPAPGLRSALSLQPYEDQGTVGDILTVAVVLPERFYHSPESGYRERSGEIALMRAVLTDALACFQKQFVSGGQRVRRLATEAEQWFLSDDSRWLFSFVHICGVLGLDPEYIRLGLKRWQQQSPMEFRRKKIHRRPAARVSAAQSRGVGSGPMRVLNATRPDESGRGGRSMPAQVTLDWTEMLRNPRPRASSIGGLLY